MFALPEPVSGKLKKLQRAMSSKSSEDLTNEVKKHTRGVLLSKIGGVALLQFEKDYQALVGKRFPHKELGFSSCRFCLESFTNTVRFEYSDTLEELMLFGIADTHSFMSSPAIRAQFTPDKPIIDKGKRPKNKKFSPKKSTDSDEPPSKHSAQNPKKFIKRGNHKRLANDQRADDEIELRANMKGLYSLCVVNLPFQFETHVQELFSEVASPEESSRGGAHFFLRYSNRSEAEDIISRFNNFDLNGEILKVKPAKEKMVGREGTRSASPKSNKSTSRDSVEGKQAPRLDSRAKANGSGSKSGNHQLDRTDEANGQSNKVDRPWSSSNKHKNFQQFPPRGRVKGDAKQQSPDDKVTPRLPQQHLVNGDALGAHQDVTESSLDSTVHKLESFAGSRPVEAQGPSTQTDTIGAVCNRVIPKPARRSIADLAYRFKGTNIDQPSLAGSDSKTC